METFHMYIVYKGDGKKANEMEHMLQDQLSNAKLILRICWRTQIKESLSADNNASTMDI